MCRRINHELAFFHSLQGLVAPLSRLGPQPSSRSDWPPSQAVGQDKPNILVIMGDDIGITNISAYSHGIMGYQTPNIDRIAKEGAMFTDYYGEQSCTAGRAAFITGQSPFRVGLTKVGMPGAKQGISDKDPTLAQLLKPHGYTSGQFGKNHLGDRNEFLPTVHGFDEYAGVLYHLNALEEPENVDYPKDPEFFKKFGPRNVIHTWATDKVDKTEDPRIRRGRQAEDQGPRQDDHRAHEDLRRRDAQAVR